MIIFILPLKFYRIIIIIAEIIMLNLMITPKCILSNQNKSLTPSYTKLDKIFRLYSPDNMIRNKIKNCSENKKQTQKSVVQLVFPHPNLLFIHPQKIKDPAEKQAFMQLNMLKNIVERKKQNASINSRHFTTKPMTAPNMSRKELKNGLPKSPIVNQHQDGINICNLRCEKQNAENDLFSVYSRKQKAFTSKTKFRKWNSVLKEESQQGEEKQHQNKLLDRGMFDMRFQEKKQSIKKKYSQDKLQRQNKYRMVLKNPQTQLYLKMQRKLTKFRRS